MKETHRSCLDSNSSPSRLFVDDQGELSTSNYYTAPQIHSGCTHAVRENWIKLWHVLAETFQNFGHSLLKSTWQWPSFQLWVANKFWEIDRRNDWGEEMPVLRDCLCIIRKHIPYKIPKYNWGKIMRSTKATSSGKTQGKLKIQICVSSMKGIYVMRSC